MNRRRTTFLVSTVFSLPLLKFQNAIRFPLAGTQNLTSKHTRFGFGAPLTPSSGSVRGTVSVDIRNSAPLRRQGKKRSLEEGEEMKRGDEDQLRDHCLLFSAAAAAETNQNADAYVFKISRGWNGFKQSAVHMGHFQFASESQAIVFTSFFYAVHFFFPAPCEHARGAIEIYITFVYH